MENLGLLEEQLGYQEQAKERYRVVELLGILKEHGFDPVSSAPAFEERPVAPPVPPDMPEEEERSFWGELKRATLTKSGRQELWTFVRNGFTLRG